MFCGDKSIIRADYMIDDHGNNLRTFQGTGVLFTASHNLHEQDFVRVNDWLEVRDLLSSRNGTTEWLSCRRSKRKAFGFWLPER